MDIIKTVRALVNPKQLCLVCITTVLLLPTSFADQSASVEDYLNAYIEARQTTIDGVRGRLELLKKGASADATFNMLDQQNQDQVHAAYTRYGFTSTSHLEFGTENRDMVERWLTNNPNTERLLEAQSVELEGLSEQIRAIQEEG